MSERKQPTPEAIVRAVRELHELLFYGTYESESTDHKESLKSGMLHAHAILRESEDE